MIISKINDKNLDTMITVYNSTSICEIDINDNIVLIKDKHDFEESLEDICGGLDFELINSCNNESDNKCFSLVIPHKAILICEIIDNIFEIKLLRTQGYYEPITQYILKYVLLSCLVYCLNDLTYQYIHIKAEDTDYQTCAVLSDNNFLRKTEFDWFYTNMEA